MRVLILLAVVTLTAAASDRLSNFERVTPLRFIRSQSDDIRKDLDALGERICKTENIDPDQITFINLAEHSFKFNEVFYRICGKNIIAPGEVSRKEQNELAQKCMLLVVALAKEQKTVPSKVSNTDCQNACFNAFQVTDADMAAARKTLEEMQTQERIEQTKKEAARAELARQREISNAQAFAKAQAAAEAVQDKEFQEQQERIKNDPDLTPQPKRESPKVQKQISIEKPIPIRKLVAILMLKSGVSVEAISLAETDTEYVVTDQDKHLRTIPKADVEHIDKK